MIVPPGQLNRTSRELADTLRRTIADFQATHPKASAEDVRAALQEVTPGGRMSRARRAAVIASFALGAVVAGIVGSTKEARSQGRPVPWIPVIALLAGAAAVVTVMWIRARDE